MRSKYNTFQPLKYLKLNIYRLRNLCSEQSAQLSATHNDVERLQQENVVLRSSQESTLSGVQDQEVKSLRLSQDMANMSRENEESARKLTSVNTQYTNYLCLYFKYFQFIRLIDN